MKIGIITHYDVHNHGALLQLNALIRILSSLGIEAQALQYDKNYDFLGINLKNKYNISIKSIYFYINYIKKEGLKKTLFNIKKKKTLDLFKKRNNLIGEYYSQTKNIDAIVIGSDEVFALHTGPTPILFGHASPCKFVFTYAASFGPTTIEDIKRLNCLSFVQSGINSLASISVRDLNSYNIIKELISRDVTIVCDPVILYGYSKEISLHTRINLPSYILLYSYDKNMNTSQEIQEIRTIAEKNSLKIVSVGFYHSWCDYNINADPIKLLHYFCSAQKIITDTFHGSVLSIITNKEFAVKTRDNSNKLYNLLDEYNLTDRIITTSTTYEEIFQEKINYESVNKEIENRRKISMNFLTKTIKQIKK